MPLRPMTLGVILAGSFQTLRRNPRPTLGPALLISLVTAVIGTLTIGGYLSWLFGIVEGAPTDTLSPSLGLDDPQTAGGLLGSLLGILALGVVSLLASTLLQGVVVAEVARGTLGEKLTLAGLWRIVRGRAGALLGWALILLAIVSVVLVAVIAVVAGLVAIGGAAGIVGLLLFVGLVILGGLVLWFWLSTRLAFVPAAIVLERLSIRAAVVRSWTLTRGSFWRVLGIQLLVSVMIYVASQVVSTPIGLIAGIAGGLLSPTGSMEDSLGMLTAISGVTYAVTGVVTAIGLVLQSATSGLLYLDLRMRREGLDLELARVVEARAAGAETPDPYLPRRATA